MNEYSMHGLTRLVGLTAALMDSPPSQGRDLALAHVQTLTNKMFGESSYTKVFYSAVTLLSMAEKGVDPLKGHEDTRTFALELIADAANDIDRVVTGFKASPGYDEYIAGSRALQEASSGFDALKQRIAAVDTDTLPDLEGFDRIPDA